MTVKTFMKSALAVYIKLFVLLLLSGLQHTWNFSYAQYLTGAEAAGAGGAGVACLGPGEAVLLNPATVALQNPLETTGYYRDGYKQSGNHQTSYGVTISDNSEDVILAGALTYLRGARNIYGLGVEEQFWMATLASRISEPLSLGINISHLTSDVTGGKQHKQLTGTIGAHVIFNEALHFGLVYENFMNPDNETPISLELSPYYRMGLRYSPLELFSMRMDLGLREQNNKDQDGEIRIGVETFSSSFTALRLGYRIDDYAKQNYATAGLAFDGPRLKASYSFEKPVKGTGGAMHGVDLRVGF